MQLKGSSGSSGAAHSAALSYGGIVNDTATRDDAAMVAKHLIVERTVMSVTVFLSQCRFHEPMDHENAIRLLRALVARGCKSDEPMADAFIRAIALEIGLGNEFDPAFVYAVKQGWLDETKKWGWTNLRGSARWRRSTRCAEMSIRGPGAQSCL